MPATIRLLHHLARSGGTLLAKALGCMQGVVLLSEINPRWAEIPARFAPMTHWLDPRVQAAAWHGLISPAEAESLAIEGPRGFAFLIGLLAERAEARGGHLLIRDWSHLDFHAWPFLAAPSGQLSIVRALEGHFRLLRAASWRHPAPQWQSLKKVTGHPDPASYLAGCLGFAAAVAPLGPVRHEDFTRDPEAALRALCDRLELDYDPGWRERWFAYDKVTGDEVSRARIEPARLPAASDPARLALAALPDYGACLRLMGYPDEPSSA